MTVFENQGEGAASSEPFSDWCTQHEINLGVMTAFEQADQLKVAAWNSMLFHTHRGDLLAAATEVVVIQGIESDKRMSP